VARKRCESTTIRNQECPPRSRPTRSGGSHGARNKTACRLHALLAELVPGGIPHEINAASAERMLAGVKPHSPVEVARHALALEHLDDLRRLDAQMRVSKARIAQAIAASGTSLTELFGSRPIQATQKHRCTTSMRRSGRVAVRH
jgi:hypothetical protein